MKNLITQDRIQLFILLAVAGMAGAASFTHVHDWTMHNTPHGTGSWFGWANAVITELVPAGAGIEIRRRKRLGYSVTYPMTILIIDAGVSLAAQISDALKTFAGGLAFALPALAFLALTKLILSRPASTTGDAPCSQNQNPAGAQAPTTTGTTTPDGSKSPSATTAPPAEHSPEDLSPDQSPSSASATIFPAKTGSSASAAPSAPAPAAADSAREPQTDTPAEPGPVPSGQLLMSARMAAFAHQQATGYPITSGQLAERMNIPQAQADTVLPLLGGAASPLVTAVNGTAISGSRP